MAIISRILLKSLHLLLCPNFSWQDIVRSYFQRNWYNQSTTPYYTIPPFPHILTQKWTLWLQKLHKTSHRCRHFLHKIVNVYFTSPSEPFNFDDSNCLHLSTKWRNDVIQIYFFVCAKLVTSCSIHNLNHKNPFVVQNHKTLVNLTFFSGSIITFTLSKTIFFYLPLLWCDTHSIAVLFDVWLWKKKIKFCSIKKKIIDKFRSRLVFN